MLSNLLVLPIMEMMQAVCRRYYPFLATTVSEGVRVHLHWTAS